MKRFRRILSWGAPAGLLIWIALSGAAAWKLTRRSDARREEPVSRVAVAGVEAHRLRSEDGLEIGAWLIRPTEKRPVVLLLHGNGASRSSFSGLISFLAKEGCGALAISLRAHGDSMGDVNDFGVGAAQDVVAAVAFLERELPGRKIIIVGESLGSSAALFAAKAASTRVQGYLFAAPFDSLDQAIWNRCENRLLPPFSHAAYAGLVLWGPAFLPESVGFIRPMDHLVEIPETVPVVFFASEDDRYARLDQVRSMAERIRSHASLITVKGGSHGRFLALHAEEYRRAILDWWSGPRRSLRRSPDNSLFSHPDLR